MTRAVLALLVALALVPAARADAAVTFTGVPTGPTNEFTFDVGFSAPGAVRYDCVHVFPDGSELFPDCHSPFSFRELEDGTHQLRVTATLAEGGPDEGTATFTIDTVAPPAPAITTPAESAVFNQTTVTITGSARQAAGVAVYDGETKLGDSQLTGETWTFEASLSEGPHTLTAVSTDTAGNPSECSLARHITIDTGVPAPPVIVAPEEGAVLASRTIAVSGTAEAGTTIAVFDGAAKIAETQGASWTIAAELADGAHTLTAVATDAGGDPSERSAERHVTIDTEAPAPVEPVQTGVATFAFSGEPGARFECRLEGPSGDSGFVPCASPQSYSDLAPGDYRFSLQTIDAAGNRAPTVTSRGFSIAATPVPTVLPAPAVTPAPTVAAAPTAKLGERVVIRPVSGRVRVRRPSGTAFEQLAAVATAIPVGAEIDAKQGRVRLTAETQRGKAAQRAEFSGGMFTIAQGADGVAELALSEVLAACRKTSKQTRRLTGDGKGRFRVRGRYSVATARGTRWRVEDSCQGTLTKTTQGVVSVRDIVKRRTVLVRAGRSYLAKPKRT